MQLTLISSASGTLPFAGGFTFRRGDIPAGQTAAVAGGTAQVTHRTTWPDGSLRIAEVAGTYVSTGAPVALTLSVGAAAAGAALTIANLKATGVTASIGCGAFGTVSWAGTDWDSPFLQWTAGPLMSSWIYRKAVGSDPHLVGWMEVRLWANGAVDVLPWIENGYVNVAAPTNKSATYQFTLGGTARLGAGLAIDLKHHQRTPLLSGAALSHWLDTDPGVSLRHDVAYLQATEMVPSYYVTLAPGSAVVAALPTSFTPLQQGSFTYFGDAMTAQGYQDPIGLLPEHDVAYVTAAQADAATVYASVVRNGYSAGRYGIHYRDESTNRPLRFSDHPTRVIADSAGFSSNGNSTTGTRTPSPTGGNPPTWDTAHSPSVGFLAYLVTGRWYFMEEVLFAATANYLGNGDNTLLRTGAQGLVQTAVDGWQTRASAWDWRAHVQALAVVPDADTALRTELINRANSNIDFFHAMYVAQANNPFGLILPGEQYTGRLSRIAIWQQDMVTAAWGYSRSLGLPLNSTRQTRLAEFFEWKARSIVGRMDAPAGFTFENANRFTIDIYTGTVPGTAGEESLALSQNGFKLGTGPWPVSWAAIYAKTAPLAIPGDNPLVTPGSNALATEFDGTSAARGQWAVLQPALAYAVRWGVPGAAAAYARMLGATNWTSMLLNTWASSAPVWAVKPASGDVPAWMAAAPVGRFTEAPNTAGTGGAPLNAWGTILVDSDLNVRGAAMGGHGDSSDNRSVLAPVGVDTPPGWTVVNPASTQRPPLTNDPPYFTDVGGGNIKPGARHNYAYSILDERPGVRRLFLIGYLGTYPNGLAWNTIDAIDIDTHVWDPPGTWPMIGTNTAQNAFTGIVYGVCRDELTGYIFWKADNYLWRLDPVTRVKTRLSAMWETVAGVGFGGFDVLARFPIAFSASRNALFSLQWGNAQTDGTALLAGELINPSAATPTPRVITFAPSAALSQLTADRPWYAAMDWDKRRGRFVFTGGGIGNAVGGMVTTDWTRVYDIVPNASTVWDVEFAPVLSVSTNPGAVPGAGLNSRFRYVERGHVSGFLVLANQSASIHLFRTR
jgi:hypothetical protein